MRKRRAVGSVERLAHAARARSGKAIPRKATKPSAAGKRFVRTGPLYRERITEGGVVLPDSFEMKAVPTGRLRQGLKKAKAEIQGVLGELASMMTEDFKVAEIELSASFIADGKFLGFGVGGDASITVRIRPADR